MWGGGREALTKGQEWLGGPPGRPEGVGRVSWRGRRGWEALPKGWGVRRPYKRSRRGQEHFSEAKRGLEALPEGR